MVEEVRAEVEDDDSDAVGGRYIDVLFVCLPVRRSTKESPKSPTTAVREFEIVFRARLAIPLVRITESGDLERLVSQKKRL